MRPRNDRALALSAFCLELEIHRRTPEGRVRTAESFLEFYFSRKGGVANDRLFLHLPPEVRGPIVASWGIRGKKAALRDDDDRVRAVVQDALDAEDLDAAKLEAGVAPDVLVDWVPLDEWWTFWRGTSLPNAAVQKALATARALHLVDDRWFFEAVEGRSGKLRGTDAICDTLTKDEVVAWIKNIHASGDASPAGLVHARGWEALLAKTSAEALLVALDAFARKVHLAPTPSTLPQPLSRPPLEGFGQLPVDEYVGGDEVESIREPPLRSAPPPLPGPEKKP
ncbi:MAG: hypothetical protein JST00_10155 [Deltaproteobacteria bacterium]|nr:hypothetical protein [Deltaproteobacteria bacterium]